MVKESGGMKGLKSFFLANKNLQILIIIVGIFLIFQVGLAWYLLDVVRNKPTAQNLSNLQESAQLDKKGILDLSNGDPEAGEVVKKISKHILLPARDFHVYTVNDAPILWKENPILYQYVLNGNKLVTYDTGIIVYNQELDKIVDVVQFYGEREKKLQSADTSAIKQ